jgi:carboxyl-terminal processing protease
MMQRAPALSRPVVLFVLLAGAFVGGTLMDRLVELTLRLLAPSHYPPPGVEKTFMPFWETWSLVNEHYVDRDAVQPEKMTHGAIEGMLASLGDYGHTTFLTADEFEKMKSGLEGQLVGIGARMSLRQRVPTVENTFRGSPARAAGLRRGDVILAVNGKSVAGLPLDQVVNLVRGPEGQAVELQVGREGVSEPIKLEIKRARVEVPDVIWHMLPGAPVAHLAIQNFGTQADTQLKTAIHEARQAGARALIVDVRGNAGGLKEQAVKVTSQFLSSGVVFIEQDAKGNKTEIEVLPGATATDLPLCVLIDRGTASSAEIFAGAIQDHGRGKLIGKKTFGTGTVLQPFPLSDGSKVLLAIYQWLTPKGRTIWHNGIVPDLDVTLPDNVTILFPEPEVEGVLTPETLAKNDDKQLLKALEVVQQEIHEPSK